MWRTVPWLLVVTLTCCTGGSVGVSDGWRYNPPFIRQQEARAKHQDVVARFEERHPGKAYVPRLKDRRSWFHNAVMAVLTLSFMPHFGWLVNRHALPLPGDLIAPPGTVLRPSPAGIK